MLRFRFDDDVCFEFLLSTFFVLLVTLVTKVGCQFSYLHCSTRGRVSQSFRFRASYTDPVMQVWKMRDLEIHLHFCDIAHPRGVEVEVVMHLYYNDERYKNKISSECDAPCTVH